MSYTVVTDNDLNRVAPPNLPNAPQLYDPRFQEQFNNILRLYFNQLNNILGQLQTTEILSEATVIDGGLPSQAYDSVTDNAELTPSGFFNGGTP